MATTPSKDENPIRPDQSDVVQTDLSDIGKPVGPSQDPDAPPLDPDVNPDYEDDNKP